MPPLFDIVVHLPLALCVMLPLWALGRRLGVANGPAVWLGWVAGAMACIVREITQHEYRWIAAYGHGVRANMPVLEGLNFWDWTPHSHVETLGAFVLSALVALAIARWR